MRIVAMSDSHGDSFALEQVFRKTAGSGNVFVHLGDGERELDMMRLKYPDLDIRHVAGNCDYHSMSPNIEIIFAGDIKVLCTHGHLYGVIYGTEMLRSIARDNGCKAVLFGHTHCRYESYEDGIYLLNPGSCSCPRDYEDPSFGWIDITPSGIITNIANV